MTPSRVRVASPKDLAACAMGGLIATPVKGIRTLRLAHVTGAGAALVVVGERRTVDGCSSEEGRGASKRPPTVRAAARGSASAAATGRLTCRIPYRWR